MRSIIHEQPTESPVAAGVLEYWQDGVATGAVESWRRTAVTDGYQFLRVDLDARAAKSGHTYLYHAVINPQGRVERLKYRFWGDGLRVAGDLVLEDTAVSASRTVNNENFEQVLDLPPGYHCWFPSVMGLHFVGQWGGVASKTAVTLNGAIGGPDTLAVQVVEFELAPLITDYFEAEIAGKTRQYAPWRLSWGEQWRIIWRSAADGWPLGMERVGLNGEGMLTAVATRLINYQTI